MKELNPFNVYGELGVREVRCVEMKRFTFIYTRGGDSYEKEVWGANESVARQNFRMSLITDELEKDKTEIKVIEEKGGSNAPK